MTATSATRQHRARQDGASADAPNTSIFKLTEQQSTRIDAWLEANMHGNHTAVWAADKLRRVVYPMVDAREPLGWELLHPLCCHIRWRCHALGLKVRKLDNSQHFGAAENARCSVCGAEFVPFNGSVKRCPRCRALDKRPSKRGSSPILPRPCTWCGMEFTPASQCGKYCSKDCFKAAKNARSRQRYADKRGRSERLYEALSGANAARVDE